MSITFRDVKADIMSRITRGIWAPGTLLPNEVDLAERYECARATVNRAMRELVEEGIIERRRKAGTRVRQAPMRSARFEIPIIRKEIEDGGAEYAYRLLNRSEEAAPVWLRERLELEDGVRALHLECLHLQNGAPYQLEDRWINLSVLPQASEESFGETGPNEWLVATVPFSSVEISFTATAADEDMAAHMGCEEDAPLFTTERSTWWEGRAITLVRLYFRPGYRMTTTY